MEVNAFTLKLYGQNSVNGVSAFKLLKKVMEKKNGIHILTWTIFSHFLILIKRYIDIDCFLPFLQSAHKL